MDHLYCMYSIHTVCIGYKQFVSDTGQYMPIRSWNIASGSRQDHMYQIVGISIVRTCAYKFCIYGLIHAKSVQIHTNPYRYRPLHSTDGGKTSWSSLLSIAYVLVCICKYLCKYVQITRINNTYSCYLHVFMQIETKTYAIRERIGLYCIQTVCIEYILYVSRQYWSCQYWSALSNTDWSKEIQTNTDQ